MDKEKENKTPDTKLYYRISEIADMLNVNQSLIRFWEKEFNIVIKNKNKKGDRLFTKDEINKFKRIYELVKVKGYTLPGAKDALKQKVEVKTNDNNDELKNIVSQLKDIYNKL